MLNRPRAARGEGRLCLTDAVQKLTSGAPFVGNRYAEARTYTTPTMAMEFGGVEISLTASGTFPGDR